MSAEDDAAAQAAKDEAVRRFAASMRYIAAKYGHLAGLTQQVAAQMAKLGQAWHGAGTSPGDSETPGGNSSTSGGGGSGSAGSPQAPGVAWGSAGGSTSISAGGGGSSASPGGGGGSSASPGGSGSGGGGGGWYASGGLVTSSGLRYSNPVTAPGFDSGGPPVVAGSVTGYRWWTIVAPDLDKSPAYADMEWPRMPLRGAWAAWDPGVNHAACLANANTGALRDAHDQASVPERVCGCVTPDTRVLTADLMWVPAGELETGDHLLAFDEYPLTRGYGNAGGRKYRDAVVANTERGPLPCYDLQFDDGTRVRVSADHQWLCYSGQKAAHWVRTDELRAGEQRASWVVKPFIPWTTDESREAGYLAAAFDGEGHLYQNWKRYQFRVGFTQADNPMLAETERCLKELGFQFGHGVKERGDLRPRADGSPRLDIHHMTIASRPDFLRFLGTVRPVRLLPQFQPGILGRLNGATRVRLVSKTYVGQQEVVKLGTTTGTYFAEGLASHNCGYWAYWGAQRHELGRPGSLPVFGVIKGYGKTLAGPHGFRCAKARILAVHLPVTIGDAKLLYAERVAEITAHHQYRHPQFTGRVYNIGTDHVPWPLQHRDLPDPPTEDEIAQAKQKGEAWAAVIGDRIERMYPGVEVCETRDHLLAKYPPDKVYGRGLQL